MKNTLPIEKIKKELVKYEWSDDVFLISFDYKNIDGDNIHVSSTIEDLWIDWWTECNFVPENDTICHNISIQLKNKALHYCLDNDEVDKLQYLFEDLMGDLGYCLALETIEMDDY